MPDVVWQSPSHDAEHGDTTPVSVAPEICVEVLSPSNSAEELAAKRELDLAAGVKEVWLCRADGRMTFFAANGELPRWGLAPEFPSQID